LSIPGACVGSTCATFYLVSSGGIGGQSVLALYQETNGLGGLQRGNPPTLQGGHDDCWVSGPKDARIL
ncbi:MAG TPA: hypothetical protein VFH78_11930, partial [Candidatus Thermoplasmatota archaeon]|nr:hypothetical protein [Candidatus Thermoplasmatota archaeon]